jgi:hypothetical protein
MLSKTKIEGGGAGAEDGPALKFRNYQPKTEELKDGILAPVKISVDKELEKMGAVRCRSCSCGHVYVCG